MMLAALLACSLARGQTTEVISLAPGGSSGNQVSWVSRISADGRFVTYMSFASNLVPGDTNGDYDIFVYDRLSATTERVSLSTGGGQGDQLSSTPALSPDGRFVAFSSLATNLVPGDTGGHWDVFVRDRQSGTTERVSVGIGGLGGTDNSGYADETFGGGNVIYTSLVDVSADGRFVAFGSRAQNLAPGGSFSHIEVFVRDRQSGTTELVSAATGGFGANGASIADAISADGRFVLFVSLATNLVPGDTNAAMDTFLRDRQNGTTERVSVGPGGVEGNSDSTLGSVSADGRFVVFGSGASNFVAGDTNGSSDVFVRDRQAGTIERVSVAANGSQANSYSYSLSISPDGRFVAFGSDASNLVAGDTNGRIDIFVRDRLSGTTSRVSVATGGAEGNVDCFEPSISADGRYVAFHAWDSSLVPGDTNGFPDIYLHDRGTPPQSAFCSGDGSGTACPCGNAGVAGHGCGNSLNGTGATLSGGGSSSISMDTLVLAGAGMPDAAALYFQGTSQSAGGSGTIFGDGLRCAGGTIQRLGTKTNVAGSSLYPSGADAPVSVRGMVTSPGMRTYQIWYRNAAPFCMPSTFNMSNGLEVQWSP